MRVGDVLGRTAEPSSLSAPLIEHLVLVVYVSSRWRPIRMAYESSATPRVRFASVFLAAVGMSQCDLVYRGKPWRQHVACSCKPLYIDLFDLRPHEFHSTQAPSIAPRRHDVMLNGRSDTEPCEALSAVTLRGELVSEGAECAVDERTH